jgi:hypothetical protein
VLDIPGEVVIPTKSSEQSTSISGSGGLEFVEVELLDVVGRKDVLDVENDIQPRCDVDGVANRHVCVLEVTTRTL